MTITTGSSSNSNAQFNARGAAPAAAPQQQAQESFDNHAWSFGDAADTGPITASMGSAQALALRDKILEKYKNANDPTRVVDVLLLDREETGLYYSLIVVAMRSTPVTPGVSFFSYILENSNEQPDDASEDFAGQRVPIKQPAGDAYDDQLVTKVLDILAQQFDGQQLFNAGATVVPRHFNQEDTIAVHQLSLLSSRAANTNLRQRLPGYQEVNLRDARGDQTLEVGVRFERRTILDEVQNPVRSDMLIEFSSTSNNADKSRSLNNAAARRDSTFGRISAFIEPVWAPVQQAGNTPWSGYVQQQNQFDQKFAARMVMTNLETSKIDSLPANLLMLMTALAAGQHQTWFGAFFNAGGLDGLGKNDVDITDVGALNWEADVFKDKVGRFDTRSVKFDANMFADYMMRLFRPGLIYSVDVPLCGTTTWKLDALRDASEPGRHQAAAREAIIRASDVLTDGEFGKIYTGQAAGQPMFVEQGNLVHLGYYTLGGVKRDIRDFDYTAMANYFGGKEDMSKMLIKWTDTFLRTDIPLWRRMADRWELIQGVASSAVFTGYAYRVTPSMAYLDCLSTAAVNAGLQTRLKAPINAVGLQPERGVFNAVSQAMMPAGASPMFYQSGGQTNQSGGGQAHYHSRYY